jgi:hypothetical protein
MLFGMGSAPQCSGVTWPSRIMSCRLARQSSRFPIRRETRLVPRVFEFVVTLSIVFRVSLAHPKYRPVRYPTSVFAACLRAYILSPALQRAPQYWRDYFAHHRAWTLPHLPFRQVSTHWLICVFLAVCSAAQEGSPLSTRMLKVDLIVKREAMNLPLCVLMTTKALNSITGQVHLEWLHCSLSSVECPFCVETSSFFAFLPNVTSCKPPHLSRSTMHQREGYLGMVTHGRSVPQQLRHWFDGHVEDCLNNVNNHVSAWSVCCNDGNVLELSVCSPSLSLSISLSLPRPGYGVESGDTGLLLALL